MSFLARRSLTFGYIRSIPLLFHNTTPASFQCRNLHQNLKVVPDPTTEVPDVPTFLEKIGRGCKGHADVFENWESLFTLSSAELKEKGIETHMRRYILNWRNKFRHGENLIEIKQGKKSYFGTERRRRETKAKMRYDAYKASQN